MILESVNALKTTPPRLRKNTFVRKRLRDLRDKLADSRVVLIEAPAGFGKTSTLAQWRAEWLGEGAVVAWLSLDAEDDAVSALWNLVYALRGASEVESFGSSIPKAESLPISALLTALLAEISGLPREVVLIIDDADRPKAWDFVSILAYLFNNAPQNLRLVVSSRQSLNLDTMELASHGDLWRLGVNDLRLDLAEGITFISSRLRASVDIDSCAKLYDLTEGWIMGLYLAIAIIERSPDPQRTISSLSERPDRLAKDLIRAAIAVLPDGVERFLLYCSHLEAMHPELCETVTDDSRAREFLQRLLTETPLVTAIDGTDWTRLHPLAREFFREGAERLPPGEIKQLHSRAEEWFAARGQQQQAAAHAYLAGHTDRWIELITGCLYDLLLKGQIGLLADWCSRLPPEVFTLNPRLRLAAAWSAAVGEQPFRAVQQLAPMAPMATDAGSAVEASEEATLILATADLMRDDLEGTRRWMDRLGERWFSPDRFQLQTANAAILANLSIHAGATERARYFLMRARPDRPQIVHRAYGDFFLGVSYLWEGRAELAEGVLQDTYYLLEKETGRRGVLTTMFAAGLAAALWDQNRCEEARSLLANRIDVIERCALPAAVGLGFQALSRLAVRNGDETRALSLLEELFALGESRGIVRFKMLSHFEQIRIHAAKRRPILCASLVERLDAILGAAAGVESDMPLISLYAALARAYAAIAQADFAAAERQLEQAVVVAKKLNRQREFAQLLALRAMVAGAAGRTAGVAAMLDESLSLAESLGQVRLFDDTLPEVAALIRHHLQSQGGAAVSPAYRDTLLNLDAVVEAPLIEVPLEPSLITVLTPKEYEVLCLLADKLPNKRIAEAMDVSAETVKWHLKNIFSKLDAASREHAVHRARILGLLVDAGVAGG